MTRSDTEPLGPGSEGTRTGDLLQAGFVLEGRYEVLDVLGSGGSAVVYRVLDRRLKRELALKMLRSDRVTRSESQRLQREVRIARDVRSEHLVRIYDVGGSDAAAYITMELVEGETLAEKLRRDGALPIEEALQIAVDTLAALQSLHENQIVHRDVKPSNIMLTPTGEVRLGDLGLARTNRGDETAVTSPETLVGTWEYISPEQAVGASIGPQSDLYSFGVTLFEMLAGTLPFKSDSAVGFVTAHLSRKPPRLSSVRPNVPHWLARVVDRLLEKRLDQRYATASDVLNDLHRQRATRPVRRTQILIAAACLALALTTALGWTLWSRSRYERFVFVDDYQIEGRDRAGRPLWNRQVRHADLVEEFHADGVHRIACSDVTEESPTAKRRTILIINPQTGAPEREVVLPTGAGVFEGMPDEFSPVEIKSVDLDHNGDQELSITFAHRYWPSFSVLWDPVSERKEVTFLASGHHRLAGAADLNGDGLDELLYFGINNRMEWNRGLAAVEPRFGNENFSRRSASTPDYDWLGSARDGLLWYALAGVNAELVPSPRIDNDKRQIEVQRNGQEPLVLDFHGFAVDSSSELSPEQRGLARRSAYETLARGNRYLAARSWDAARESFKEAGTLANRAGAPTLTRHARHLQLRAAIRAGRISEAERLIEALTPGPGSSPSQTQWEAANAYHLAGELERAVVHYQRGMAFRVESYGRATSEFVLGAVFALLELEEPEEALRIVRTYERSDFNSASDESFMRAWIHYMAGWEPVRDVDFSGWRPYEYQYWELELRRSEREPQQMLRDIERLRETTSGMEPMLLSLRADVLLEQGHTQAALEVSQQAFDRMTEEIVTSTMVRGHAKLILERHERIAKAAGVADAIADAEAFSVRLAQH